MLTADLHAPADAVRLRTGAQPARLTLDEALSLIDGENGVRMRRLISDHRDRYAHARGSSRNHQAWPGGFWDHTLDLLNLACVQYAALSACRPLEFSLSDALLILTAHDLEKMVRFDADGNEDPRLSAKADKANFRLDLLAEYGIKLTPVQANALKHAEGVRDIEYVNTQRTMSPLAAFVHTCDLLSARMWFNYPLPAGQDPWEGAERSHPASADITLPGEIYAPDGTCLGKAS